VLNLCLEPPVLHGEGDAEPHTQGAWLAPLDLRRMQSKLCGLVRSAPIG
jgi:hypothetical protein